MCLPNNDYRVLFFGGGGNKHIKGYHCSKTEYSEIVTSEAHKLKKKTEKQDKKRCRYCKLGKCDRERDQETSHEVMGECGLIHLRLITRGGLSQLGGELNIKLARDPFLQRFR